ncbi:NADPH-dependent F420 reductase [Mucilaginibacter jinjuensis]|uniref:NADPH-dependent F420 reductase n=1 Tax=Mucilaginibacter jinjuensis TaxID=1176721 RepID=A0ABY7TE98_9SPHI|nr:NADPH-dependent F420 reductase [Mucilaginibacter jinjuensis]WCT14361.1 NADPH-dependent F420 reductase [Mucilaginibacter jinjuensis]
MKIGILGAGTIGKTLAEKLVAAGHEVEISNSSGPESLQTFTAKIGPRARAVNNQEAAGNEVIILAVRWENTDEVLSQLKDQLQGKILIDATNPFSQNKWLFVLPKGVAASEIIAAKAPGAKVVKAFNNLIGDWLASPQILTGKRVIFISGDDDDAKATVSRLVADLNFAPIDLGTLKDGELSQGGRALAGQNLVLLEG